MSRRQLDDLMADWSDVHAQAGPGATYCFEFDCEIGVWTAANRLVCTVRPDESPVVQWEPGFPSDATESEWIDHDGTTSLAGRVMRVELRDGRELTEEEMYEVPSRVRYGPVKNSTLFPNAVAEAPFDVMRYKVMVRSAQPPKVRIWQD